MEYIKSPLVLEKFYVLQNDFVFVQPNEDFQKETFDDYPINVDFSIEEFDAFFKMFVNLSCNHGKEVVTGMKFKVEAVGIFSIKDQEQLPEDVVNNLRSYTPVGIMINNLRGYLINMTSYSPFGPYILPLVDVNFILKEKIQQIKSLEEKKVSKAKKVRY